MNIIIKLVQMTIVSTAMSGIVSAAPPTNDTDDRSPSTGTASCKIAPGQNTCHTFMFDPGIEFPTNTDMSDFNQIAVDLRPAKKTRRFTFTLLTHHGGASYIHRALENSGFVSASLGLSRITHNENLEIVDSDASNEHARINLIIHLKAIPAIEKYLQFVTSTGYFTIAK